MGSPLPDVNAGEEVSFGADRFANRMRSDPTIVRRRYSVFRRFRQYYFRSPFPNLRCLLGRPGSDNYAPFPRCRCIDLGLPEGWVRRNEEIGALLVEGYASMDFPEIETHIARTPMRVAESPKIISTLSSEDLA